MPTSLDPLIDELTREITSSSSQPWTDAEFLGWARRIARLQAASPGSLERRPPPDSAGLQDLPAITTQTFRYADVRAFQPTHPTQVVFRTSGTTGRFRGRHALYRTDVYQASALAAFDLLVDPNHRLARMISLVPPVAEAPDSSLAFMVSTFAIQRFPPGATDWAVTAEGLDVASFESALAAVGASDRPALLVATTLAANALLEAGAGAALPAGSLILTTGGAKGRDRDVDATEVDAHLAERFPGAEVGAEYGMTELLSQAYRIGQMPFRLPPWCRVLAIDPRSGRRQPHNVEGLLRFIDLANIQSAVTVQTADLGATHSDHTFTLLGRAPGARLRGCSLTFEEVAGGSS